MLSFIAMVTILKNRHTAGEVDIGAAIILMTIDFSILGWTAFILG